MKQTINRIQFIEQMQSIRPNNFSREGLGEMFFYFDEMGEENEMEFDPIAICCDFSQCSLDDFLNSFSEVECDYNSSDKDKRIAISDYIDNCGFWYSFVEDGKEIVFKNF